MLTEHKNDHDIWGWKCRSCIVTGTNMRWDYFIVLWFRILVIITCKLWYTFFFFLKYILLVKISKVFFIFQIRNVYMRDIAENIDPYQESNTKNNIRQCHFSQYYLSISHNHCIITHLISIHPNLIATSGSIFSAISRI
jgi:hypothetical protein